MLGKGACIGKAAGNRWRDSIQTGVFTKRSHVCQPLWVQPSMFGHTAVDRSSLARPCEMDEMNCKCVEIRVAAP